MQGIDKLADLRGKKIVVENDYITEKWLKVLEPKIELIIKENSKSCLVALSSGEAEGYVGNLLITSYMIPVLGISTLEIAGSTPFGIHSLAMAARKDWAPLISIINKGLKAISTEQHFAIKKNGQYCKRLLSLRS